MEERMKRAFGNQITIPAFVGLTACLVGFGMRAPELDARDVRTAVETWVRLVMARGST
jgi:hypothetical protein